MPKVSVIVPVYGVEKYIERCARSLFEQTLDDIEYIFVDDCTRDNSIAVLRKVMDSYPHRVPQTRIEKMPHNSGLAAVRRKGISLASGDYLIACDSDDYVEKDMYKVMYCIAIDNNSDLVQCDIDVVDGENVIQTIAPSKSCLSSDELREGIINGVISNSLCNKLVKKELYCCDELVFPSVAMDEDNAVAVQLAFFSRNAHYIRRPFYKAFWNPKSISRQAGETVIVSRARESFINSQFIVSFLTKHGYSNKSLSVLNAKLRPKITLFPVLYKYANLKIWRNTYPEINFRSIFDFRVPHRVRFKSFLAMMGLYPIAFFLYRIKRPLVSSCK